MTAEDYIGGEEPDWGAPCIKTITSKKHPGAIFLSLGLPHRKRGDTFLCKIYPAGAEFADIIKNALQSEIDERTR